MTFIVNQGGLRSSGLCTTIKKFTDPIRDQESIQQLKNVLSTGHTSVEIKYGSMVFDSKLVIISSNLLVPSVLAGSMGKCYQAIFRRFTDTCSAWELRDRHGVTSMKFKTGFMNTIIRCFSNSQRTSSSYISEINQV